MAVAVALAVGFVVAPVVAQQVAQVEAVVRGDEVHGGGRRPAAVAELAAGRQQPVREGAATLGALAALTQPEAAHRVAVAVVPFEPAGWEVTEPVTARAHVPGLGDQQRLRQHRVLRAGGEEGGAAVEAAAQVATHAADHRREVEAEAVHAEFGDPVAQAVGGQLHDARLREIQAVAAAGPVLVVEGVVRAQAVIQRVVDAAQRQRGAELVGLAAVVIDDVDHQLHAARMHRVGQGTEFGGGRGAGPAAPVAGLGREEGDRAVAPVVRQAQLLQPLLVGAVLHRHQAQRGHAQALQVVEHGRLGQAGVGAAKGLGHVGMQAGHATHVQFIEHALTGRDARPARGRQAQRRGDAGLERRRPAVARIGHVRLAGCMAEEEVFAAVHAHHLAGVGIEQQLRRVEAQSLAWRPRAVHPEAVDQPRSPGRQPAVPDAVGVRRQRQALLFLATHRVEEAQLHGRGRRRCQCEVDPAFRQQGGAQGVRGTGGQHRRLLFFLIAACARVTGDAATFCLRNGAVHASTHSTVASGGTVITADCAWPCQGTGWASTGALPTPDPPYTAWSVLMASRQVPACGRPSR
ncbi:Uncharacterised protein [Xylophilus ampelinus]|nr:Uncharacterised protein [Xylophilus ampelinus]